MDKSFPLGTLVWTRAVNDTTAGDGPFAGFVHESLKQFSRGDWGDVNEDDWTANDQALRDGNRLLGSYQNPDGEKIWIIYEGDRSQTTILFPDEG